MDRAKIFTNGRSQAVRLPIRYRFEGTEVYIRKDDATGDVILSKRAQSWSEFAKLRDEDDPDVREFMIDRQDPAPSDRQLL